MAAQEANIAKVLTAQIVLLNDTIGRMQQTISQLESRFTQAEEDALRSSRRGRKRSGEDDDAEHPVRDLIFDKLFEPSPFTKSSGP